VSDERLGPGRAAPEATSQGEGGVGDGHQEDGEPLLARWFAVLLVVLVPVGVAVTIWAFTSIDRTPITPAERRPPGTAEVTHERGQAALNETTETADGPGCAADIEVFGDEGARAAANRTLGSVCTLLSRGGFEDAALGLDRWAQQDGRLRFAVFEVTGLDSSARVEDGRVVIELNAKFQFEDATLAAPFVIHELVHLAHGWPAEPVDVDGELAALEAQARACDTLVIRDDPPRGCNDAAEVLRATDPDELLRDAGYGPGS
jgi:hypothetical protein